MLHTPFSPNFLRNIQLVPQPLFQRSNTLDYRWIPLPPRLL